MKKAPVVNQREVEMMAAVCREKTRTFLEGMFGDGELPQEGLDVVRFQEEMLGKAATSRKHYDALRQSVVEILRNCEEDGPAAKRDLFERLQGIATEEELEAILNDSDRVISRVRKRKKIRTENEFRAVRARIDQLEGEDPGEELRELYGLVDAYDILPK